MQLLTFSIGTEHYAIESRQVIEVLPSVIPRPIPRMPPFLPGIFTHRGRLVPLVDLGWLLADHPLQQRLSTRVIVVEFVASADGTQSQAVRLGVKAENVLSLCSAPAAEAVLPPLQTTETACLGRCFRIQGQTIQMIVVEHLLPPAMVATLAALAAAPSNTTHRATSHVAPS